MTKNAAYTALGGVFEYLNSDCDYDKWSQYLIKTLRVCGAGAKGVDIGCGNGYFTRALERAGFEVSGMDISPVMLGTAVEIARKEGVRAEFLLGDITKLKLNAKVDFITAVNDCINYVPKNRLMSAFKCVFANLKRGGLFVFDISSSEKLKNVLGNNVFADDGEEASYMWFNALEADRVEMDITVFKKLENGTYSRLDEHQTQFIYEENEIMTALKEAGFEARAEGHLGGEKTERINFICRKL